ncbi:hypothetical protein CBL_21235, partial [Carabus blaptoides fortunei]
SGVVLIKGPDPQIATRLQFLKQLINDSKPATPTTIHQNHALHHSLASLPNVDHDVTTEEIQNQLAENGHTIKKTLEDQMPAVPRPRRLQEASWLSKVLKGTLRTILRLEDQQRKMRKLPGRPTGLQR